MTLRRLFSAVLMAALSACSPDDATAQDTWSRLVTAEPVSPAQDGDGNGLSWQRPDGETVKLFVRLPRPAPLTIALAPQEGDMQARFSAALDRLRASGGGTLQLAPGTYRIGGTLSVADVSDVLIAGPGATLVFMQWGDGLRIANSRRVAVQGLAIDYAEPALVPARVTRGRLVFDREPPAAAVIHQATTYDRARSSYPSAGKRLLLGEKGAPLKREADGTFSAPELTRLAEGETVMAKLAFYRGAALRVSDNLARPLSEDITFDGMTIRSSSGAGIAIDTMGRGLAILRSRIGPEDSGVPTVPYDGIHVTAAGGDILIRGNRISGTGDDGVNLASPIERVLRRASPRTLTLAKPNGRVAAGDRVALFDAEMRFLGTASIGGMKTGSDGASREVTLAAPVALTTTATYLRNLRFAGNRYAVVDNQIGHCECHGVLAQGPNGLVRGNRFAATRYNAVRVLSSGVWLEGTGGQQVVIADNAIADSGRDDKPGFVWAAISIYGEVPAVQGRGGLTRPATGPVNSGILIQGNRISEIDDRCIAVASAADVTLQGNRCSGFARRPLPLKASLRPANLATTLRAGDDAVWIDPTTTRDVTTEGEAE